MTELDQLPVTSLEGVGPALAARLERLGVATVQDMLFLLPLRYEDRTRLTPLGSLRVGDRAVIEGEIQLTEAVLRKRRALLSTLSDGTGWLTLRFFYFSRAQQAGLKKGARVRCYGEVRRGPSGLEMIHPEYQLLSAEHPAPLETTLTPIYPGTEGLTQQRIRRLIGTAVQIMRRHDVRDWVTADLLPPAAAKDLREAIEYLHSPPTHAPIDVLLSGLHPCQRRLAFEELLAHQLSLRMLRATVKHEPAIGLTVQGALLRRFIERLPFKLTQAQLRVLDEIQEDLRRDHPMLRLLQGDVGSGKTVVAAAAALCAVDSGCQAVLMAPTELLAEQHLATLRGWLEPLGIKVTWLSGRSRGKERSAALAALASGAAGVAVGTHALFQDDVEYHRLALAIVDEQHRFGVHQRLRMKKKGMRDGQAPHQLIMSATPIPRTLAMTAYADLDVSVLDERPPGRKPVTTVVMPSSRRAELMRRINAAGLAGRQIYWVCPIIEESETLAYRAAEETATELTEALAPLRVGLVHGRLAAEKKERVMGAFKRGKLDLLVATTVIEVGVDVPNASLMVIENAEALGLAQLHQLRGRVGRGSTESTCVLLYDAPLTQVARQRLEAMRATDDGFEVARRDLELRGPGEVLGTRQTGLMQLRVAELVRDADLLPAIQASADKILERQPAAADALIRRWVGTGTRYGQV